MMASVKLNISMEERAVQTLRRRAAETGKPVDRFLADLVEEDARRAQDALAEEGYRALSDETRAFADVAWPLVSELPWEWAEKGSGAPDAAGQKPGKGDGDI